MEKYLYSMKNLYNRAEQYYKQYGLIATLKRIYHHKNIERQKKLRILEIEKIANNQEEWRGLNSWIDNSQCEYIDISPVPMGWNTPLFQRFQHLTMSAEKLGGVAFYGSHPNVDGNIKNFKFISKGACLVNFYDKLIADCFWRVLDKRDELKIIRIQSIDLCTTIDDMKLYLTKGYVVVYEYIDEITPKITGNVPNLVLERHKWILTNINIIVVATSDRLFDEVKKYRNENLLMLNNGVDYKHWHINKGDIECPNDIKNIVSKEKLIIGYHGALASWIDYNLLKKIASNEKYILLLIGYEHDDSLQKSHLLNMKNVYYIGAKSYNELPLYAAFYDIAILPFAINDITLSVSPVKIFEYMAIEKPIVTYALPECKKYESCFCAKNETEFLELIQKAIARKSDNAYLSIMRKEARNNEWVEITRKMLDYVKKINNNIKSDVLISEKFNDHRKNEYIRQVLLQNEKKSIAYRSITKNKFKRMNTDCKIIAYYLTQFHPDVHNEKWWGKGVTEWNNVSRAVPQYVGHYQPRIPGELGYYDLRIKENMERQIELAKIYGIYGFSFYYYWFDGERLLEKPLEMFLANKDLDINFSICWANENWTRKFDGTNQSILLKQPESIESYCNVIKDMERFLKDHRYIEVNGKKMITVYRPSLMPHPRQVLKFWREYCRKNGVGEIYVIAIKENMVDVNWLNEGFDAVSEFHPGTLYTKCLKVNKSIDFIRDDFSGEVFSYSDIVANQRYFEYDFQKLYRAAMPMWDNTARRNNCGMIFDGSQPELYKKWLKDIILESYSRDDLDDNFIFINAWNEWGEGAYLEPDKYYGYAYLNATKEAIEECRRK